MIWGVGGPWAGGSGVERLLSARAPELLGELKFRMKGSVYDLFLYFGGPALGRGTFWKREWLSRKAAVSE